MALTIVVDTASRAMDDTTVVRRAWKLIQLMRPTWTTYKRLPALWGTFSFM